jgi:hypothetical protein
MTDFTHQDPVLCHWSETCRLLTSRFRFRPRTKAAQPHALLFSTPVSFLVPSLSARSSLGAVPPMKTMSHFVRGTLADAFIACIL